MGLARSASGLVVVGRDEEVLGVCSTVAAFWIPPMLVLAVPLTAAFYAVNVPFYRFLRRVRGGRFTLRAAPRPAQFYACAGLGLVLGTLQYAWTTA